MFEQFRIPRNCLPDNSNLAANYQLHAFCDASNSAFCCVVYLRCLVEGKPIITFVLGMSKLVLTHQTNWVISRKELEAAKLCCELTLLAKQALRNLDCTSHFWTDSQVVLGWITNLELNLARFVKRRVDKILRVSPSTRGSTFIRHRILPMSEPVIPPIRNRSLLNHGWVVQNSWHRDMLMLSHLCVFCCAYDLARRKI